MSDFTQSRKPMNITVLLSLGCGSEAALRANIADALKAETVEADVQIRRIDDKEAEKLGLSGSPTLFINGKELQPLGTAGFS